MNDADLPKHTNSLPKTDDELKPYVKLYSILIPDNATNGYAIQLVFPNCKVSEHEFMGLKYGIDIEIYICKDRYFALWFPKTW